MVHEVLFLHVGQCGNQLGHEFWSNGLKARAILIDTETGVTNEIMKGNIASYFNEFNIFTQQS
uniref:Tubulin/FtsZ GTPase domain-containing protein n=1 Tax=Piliocolobus tephrosceles TaxID=591936 RepID=A0A8C9GDB2_9PRIM